jgi:peptidoglycan-associated lipoprotein
MISLSKLACCALATALVSACAAAPLPKNGSAEAPLPDPGPDGAYTVHWPDLGRGKARYIALTIGADVADVCYLPKLHFDFDSSEPLPQDRMQIGALADCLGSRPLEGARISVIGRADPRGAPAYNHDLALRRALRIKALLVDQGLPADRIAARSTGESRAVGDQPMYSYGFDRRVDIELDGVAHTPR